MFASLGIHSVEKVDRKFKISTLKFDTQKIKSIRFILKVARERFNFSLNETRQLHFTKPWSDFI